MYVVKEIFYTLQGEGINAGRPAVFCRFAGCNLWSGHESGRATAVCTFCDTDFVGVGPDGGRFATANDLADAVRSRWPANPEPPAGTPGPRTAPAGSPATAAPRVRPLVVCTGGEPLLQLDDAAVKALHGRGFEVAVETNGTQDAPRGIDHICVSPKANAPLRLTSGTELKLVYPQSHPEAQPERFESLDFEHFLLQPMDGPDAAANTRAAIAYCLAHPQWRLSVQTHKVIGVR